MRMIMMMMKKMMMIELPNTLEFHASSLVGSIILGYGQLGFLFGLGGGISMPCASPKGTPFILASFSNCMSNFSYTLNL